MRSIVLSIAAFALSLVCLAGNGLTEGSEIYMNDHMEVINSKKEATYICQIVEQSDEGYHVKAFFLTGELKMEGWFKDEELQNPHGSFAYFHQNGQIESQGEFVDGSKFGLWERYDFEGNAKPEKIYATLQIMQAITAFK